MNAIRSTEALKFINKRLKKPINKDVFNRSIIPLMEQAGHARRNGPRLPAFVDGDKLEQWIAYLLHREQQIDAHTWKMNRKFRLEGFHAISG